MADYPLTVSDHKFIVFGFDLSRTVAGDVLNRTTNLRLNRRVSSHPLVVSTALSLLATVCPIYDWPSISGESSSFGVALLSCLTYLCFKVAHEQFRALHPSSTPTYALVYR